MRSIQANPKTIREIFRDEYVIPDYQRPYTWDEEKCEQLWEDLVNFWHESEEDNVNGKDVAEDYFLGTITLYKNKEVSEGNEVFFVVDGQQRLITLSLLIKALCGVAGTYHELQISLVKTHPETGVLLKDKPRIKSNVLEQDNEELKKSLSLGGEGASLNSRFDKNYRKLESRIEQWLKEEKQDSEKLKRFIRILLHKVKVLPIECDSQGHALTIFETLNNRGTPLNEADIFKIKIYTACLEKDKTKKEEIVKRWNNLTDHLWLFRLYMHILRAGEKSAITSEIGLGRFFAKKDWRDYEKVMSILEKLNNINQEEWSIPSSINKWWKVLQFFPNEYWQYPLYVFLIKNTDSEWTEESVLEIKEGSELAKQFEELIKWTVRYFYIRGVNRNSINAVKNTTYEIYRAIHHGNYQSKNYQEIYQNKLEVNEDFQEFKRIIVEGLDLRRCWKGMILIGAGLNQKQDDDNFYAFLKDKDKKKVHIEHILPKKWNHYDSWDDDTHSQDLWKLGNLVPCEWKINIAARNDFFSRKQERYKDSAVRDLLELANKGSDTWSPDDLKKRDQKIKKRLINFFCE